MTLPSEHIVILDRGGSLSEQLISEGTVYIIRNEFDLNGDTVVIPQNSTLKFEKGLLKNGVLKGNFTKIEADAKAVFSNIIIDGEWAVPKIRSEWFNDICDKQDVILQLFNMCNDSIDNIIIISEGIFPISIKEHKSHVPVITIKSKTEIKLDGTISLEDSEWGTYGLFDLNNVHDIRIIGKGTIKGNNIKYRGNSQSGHLISIIDSYNIQIDGITLLEAAGDGICIWGTGNNINSFISIRNCFINNAKRQGISICEGSDISVSDCVIKNITSSLRGPCAGIDIETEYTLPQTIHNVYLTNIDVDNVWSGLCVVGEKAISNVKIKNYTARNCQRYGARLTYNISDFTLEKSSFECLGNFKGTSRVNGGRCMSFCAYSGKDIFYNDITLQDNIIIKDCVFVYDLKKAAFSGNVGYICHYGINLENCRFFEKRNVDSKYYANFSILNSDKTNIKNCVIDVNNFSVSKSTNTMLSENIIYANDFIDKSIEGIMYYDNEIYLQKRN